MKYQLFAIVVIRFVMMTLIATRELENARIIGIHRLCNDFFLSNFTSKILEKTLNRTLARKEGGFSS